MIRIIIAMSFDQMQAFVTLNCLKNARGEILEERVDIVRSSGGEILAQIQV